MKNDLRFEDVTRNRLISRFREAYLQVHPEGDAELEAKIYVGSLERIVGIYSEVSPPPPVKEQRRKEPLEAFANALDRLIDAGFEMDDPSLGFALDCGRLQMAKDASNPYSARDIAEIEAASGYQSILYAYELQTKHARDLRQFALGVRLAINELPPLDKALYSFEEQVGKWIEDYLGRNGIIYSTSDTGVAGESFLAVMELAGVSVNRASYWLKKSAANADSWLSFKKRMRMRITNAE